MASDGLWRWLVGGLVAGGIVFGLLVGAYAIGYHRGQEKAKGTATSALSPPPTATTPSTTPSASGANLIAQGKQLFTADGCAGCHSLNGTPGVGPTLKGLAGGPVELADGTSATADDAYLRRSITEPDAQIVKGFQKGVMSASVKSLDLAPKPADVAALVAFINTQK